MNSRTAKIKKEIIMKMPEKSKIFYERFTEIKHKYNSENPIGKNMINIGEEYLKKLQKYKKFISVL